ncbi:hypothetical protein OROGR_023355 [Orobanche gracilis]
MIVSPAPAVVANQSPEEELESAPHLTPEVVPLITLPSTPEEEESLITLEIPDADFYINLSDVNSLNLTTSEQEEVKATALSINVMDLYKEWDATRIQPLSTLKSLTESVGWDILIASGELLIQFCQEADLKLLMDPSWFLSNFAANLKKQIGDIMTDLKNAAARRKSETIIIIEASAADTEQKDDEKEVVFVKKGGCGRRKEVT